MYKDFFDLDRNPFELSPDPSFMCFTEKGKATLASITYAITNRKGFVVMTGDAGTGKTLIVRSLFECWKSQGFAFANIFAPNVPLIDFLINATSDLGIKVAEPTKGNLLRAFHGFLVTQFQKGLTTILVIDEAHQMPAAVLEEIRMLTNVETNQQKLVQVLLVGQPELDSKLDSFELRQLKQRIAIRCRLEPLTAEETRHYVAHRLNLAGAKLQADAIFPAETMAAIHRHSGGIPRLINSVCEQAMIAACTLQIREVPVAIIDDVASLFRLTSVPDSVHAQAPSPPADLAETSGPVETWKDLSSFAMPSAKAPDLDPSLRHLSARNAAPAQNQWTGNTETSFGKSRAAVPDFNRMEPEDSNPYNSAQIDYQGANRTTMPSKPRSSESTPASAKTNEPVFLKTAATKTNASAPGNHQLSASVRMLRGSRFMYAAAIVAVAAAALLARRQNGATAVSQQFASRLNAPPSVSAETPVQPVETNSAIQFNDNSADRVAAQNSGEISKSLRPAEHLLPDPAPAIATLSRPVPKSPDLSALSEPPVITGTQTNEFLDKGMFRVSLPAPAPPVTTVGGNLQPPEIVSSPPLTTSLLERTGKIQGVVIIDALIDDKGRATDMKVVSGFPRLTEVAMEALRSWKFAPARLNGQPIAMRTKVSVDFRLH